MEIQTFTAEIGKKIYEKVRDGMRPVTAAASLGVTGDTYMHWTLTISEFKYAVMKALALAQGELELTAHKDGLKDGAGARVELARRDPMQHSEKMAVARVQAEMRQDGLPDAGKVWEAERIKQEKMEKEHAYIEGDATDNNVIDITEAKKEPPG